MTFRWLSRKGVCIAFLVIATVGVLIMCLRPKMEIETDSATVTELRNGRKSVTYSVKNSGWTPLWLHWEAVEGEALGAYKCTGGEVIVFDAKNSQLHRLKPADKATVSIIIPAECVDCQVGIEVLDTFGFDRMFLKRLHLESLQE